MSDREARHTPFLFLALLLAAVSFSLSACGGSSSAPEATGDSLTVLRTESFDGWNLDGSSSYATFQTTPAVLEGLLRAGSDGKSVVPGLADKWDYDPKKLTWTFHIRDGAKFSDGSPVTSKDVAFSEKVWASGTNYGHAFAAVKRVLTPNERTVVFEMSEPSLPFDTTIAASISGVMPANFGGKTRQEYYQHPIGAGPYKVEQWSVNGKIVLTANPHYYAPDRPGYRRLVCDVVTDENERSLLFTSGDAQIVEYVPAASASSYGEDAIEPLPPSQIYHVSLNTTKGPFANPDLRRAVAYGLNYNNIINGPLKGYATEAKGVLPTGLPSWTAPDEPYFETDLAKAKKLVAASGVSHPKVELIYDSGSEEYATIAQIIKTDLGKVGITVVTTGLETGAYEERAFTLDADMVLSFYGAITPSMIDPIGWMVATSWLFSGYDVKGLEEQFAAFGRATSEAGQTKVVSEIQNDSVADVPVVAMAESEVIHAVAPGIDGFKPAPWGLFYYDDLKPAN